MDINHINSKFQEKLRYYPFINESITDNKGQIELSINGSIFEDVSDENINYIIKQCQMECLNYVNKKIIEVCEVFSNPIILKHNDSNFLEKVTKVIDSFDYETYITNVYIASELMDAIGFEPLSFKTNLDAVIYPACKYENKTIWVNPYFSWDEKIIIGTNDSILNFQIENVDTEPSPHGLPRIKIDISMYEDDDIVNSDLIYLKSE